MTEKGGGSHRRTARPPVSPLRREEFVLIEIGLPEDAQAALTIPIMAPLGDLVGITRQTSVFAFQLAEYINPVLPTSGVTMGILGLPGLRRTISPAVEKSVTRREIGRGVSGILSE